MEATTKKQAQFRLLTLKAAAALIEGLTEYRLRRLCLDGEIRFHRFGNKYMVSDRVVFEYFGIDECA